VKSSSVCTSIEGEKISITCRKFSAQPPYLKAGKLVYPFKLSIHGTAKVKEAYSNDSQLKVQKSHWSEGDEIHGEAVDGYSGKAFRNPPQVINLTSTHKAQAVEMRGGVYAHVEIGMRDQLTDIKKIQQSTNSPKRLAKKGKTRKTKLR